MNESPSKKRKLVSYSLETKYEILKALENGSPRSKIQSQYRVKSTTLSGWIKISQQIKQQYESASSRTHAKKLKSPKNPDLENALYSWYCEMVKKDPSAPIKRDLISEKAQFLAKELGVSNFNPSNGWYSRFKLRYGLAFKRVSRDKKDDDSSQISEWQEQLQNILEEFKPKDIFNADETALFFKRAPDYVPKVDDTLDVDSEPNDRVTMLIACNMEGTEKLPLLVIGKFKKPVEFQNLQNLSLQYEYNPNAWMTPSIFTSWLQQLDNQMLAENRKIVMIVDSCLAHPSVGGLKAIKLLISPPNCSSIKQPMDHGIIRNFKMLYRKAITKILSLTYIDIDKLFKDDLLGAMYFLKKAWEEVKEDTIKTCFFQAFTANGHNFETLHGFDLQEAEYSDDDDNFFALIGTNKFDFEDRSNPEEENIPCCAAASEEENLPVAKSSVFPLEQVSLETEAPTKPPTVHEALGAAEVLRSYGMATNDEELLKTVEGISTKLMKEQFEKMVENIN